MRRTVAAVVVGLVLVCSAQLAGAKEAKTPRSELCLNGCDVAFERCQASESSKKHGSRCNIEVVRCKQECPAEPIEDSKVPTEHSHQKCVDGCRATYKACLGRAENKRGGPCAADDVRCEQACPKPPEVVTAPTPVPGAPAGAQVAPPPAVQAKPKKPRAAARVEGAAAPAPASATPAAAVGERAETAPTVRSEGGAAATQAPAEASENAVRPAGTEGRGFFGTIKCFFVACERAASTPCLTQCATAYDECRVRESKRGGECNTRLMNCRQSCAGSGR